VSRAKRKVNSIWRRLRRECPDCEYSLEWSYATERNEILAFFMKNTRRNKTIWDPRVAAVLHVKFTENEWRSKRLWVGSLEPVEIQVLYELLEALMREIIGVEV